MKSAGKTLRDAATLILACRSPAVKANLGGFDYEVLMLERSRKSNFMPEKYVFPGGAVHSADYSNDWLDLLHRMSERSHQRDLKSLQIKGERPDVMLKEMPGSHVSNEVAFRICAIRETFEESGVLVLRSFNSDTPDSSSCCGSMKLHNVLSQDELKHWTVAVSKDPSSFIELCRKVQCVPDIWSLREWGNWTTPKALPVRFRTMFYTCFFSYKPEVFHDQTEISSFQWLSPGATLDVTKNTEEFFGPPQIYEFGRLCNFTSWEDIKMFTVEREKLGCESFLPVVYRPGNRTVFFLPGDHFYEQANSGMLKEDEVLEDIKNPNPNKPMHRCVFVGTRKIFITQNYTSKNGHLLPVFKQCQKAHL